MSAKVLHLFILKGFLLMVGGWGCRGGSPHGCKHPGWATPSAAASLCPGPGFRVVTEQPIRGVGRARGLFPANTALRAALAPKLRGTTKGSPHSAVPGVGATCRGLA